MAILKFAFYGKKKKNSALRKYKASALLKINNKNKTLFNIRLSKIAN